jgi:hypothetical protein
MDKSYDALTELVIPAAVQSRNLTKRGTYRLNVIASKTGFAGTEQWREFVLQDPSVSPLPSPPRIEAFTISSHDLFKNDSLDVRVRTKPGDARVISQLTSS